MKTDYALAGTRQGAGPIPLASARRVVAALGRRAQAALRLALRRRRARKRCEELSHLDADTLRDLAMTRSEVMSVVFELDGRAPATRRRAGLDVWPSDSSRFRVRQIDSFL